MRRDANRARLSHRAKALARTSPRLTIRLPRAGVSPLWAGRLHRPDDAQPNDATLTAAVALPLSLGVRPLVRHDCTRHRVPHSTIALRRRRRQGRSRGPAAACRRTGVPTHFAFIARQRRALLTATSKRTRRRRLPPFVELQQPAGERPVRFDYPAWQSGRGRRRSSGSGLHRFDVRGADLLVESRFVPGQFSAAPIERMVRAHMVE